MAESFLKDPEASPTCAFLKGEFGVDGLYVGVPSSSAPAASRRSSS